MELVDSFNRKHDYLRISLTDRCNYNCIYCNPAQRKIDESKRSNLLSFEEIERLIVLFASGLNFKKIRFTGGEPLVRRQVFDFFERVKKIKLKYGLKIGLTTNGSLLKGRVKELKEKGIDAINISIDSLNRDKFKMITGRDDLSELLSVIEEVRKEGYNPVKLNVVVIKGINDNEIIDFVEKFKNQNVNVRFIEFMPFGSNEWERNGFISFRQMKNVIEKKYELLPLIGKENAVAKDYRIAGETGTVSFISSISEHFCSSCNRVRISARGDFRVCLFNGGLKVNFKELFRKKLSDEEIIEILQRAILTKWEKHPAAEILSQEINNNMMEIGG